MIKKAPIIFPLYWEDKEQALTAQRDADHQYYLRQFVALIEPILLDKEITMGMKLILITNAIALLKEAGLDNE